MKRGLALLALSGCMLPGPPTTARVLATGEARPYPAVGYPAAALANAGELDGLEPDYLAAQLGYRRGLGGGLELGGRIGPGLLGAELERQLMAHARFALAAGVGIDGWLSGAGGTRGVALRLPLYAELAVARAISLVAALQYRLEASHRYRPGHVLVLTAGARLGRRYGLQLEASHMAYLWQDPIIVSRDPYRAGSLGLSLFHTFGKGGE